MRTVLIDPSGAPNSEALARNFAALRAVGLDPRVGAYPDAAGERLRAEGTVARARLLTQSLVEDDIILCARGGYGISDLFDHLDWKALAARAPALVVGFSDICALQCALYARLGWASLHAPMPGSTLWHADGEDVAAVLDVLSRWPGSCYGDIALDPHQSFGDAHGVLFGGCLSVISALIGTPYFPASLAGHVVFFEDVNESAPRILRYLNQWLQSGALDGVSALVLGCFTHSDTQEQERLSALPELIAERCPYPVYSSSRFGHTSPNFPLMIGADVVIGGSQLHWEHSGGVLLANS